MAQWNCVILDDRLKLLWVARHFVTDEGDPLRGHSVMELIAPADRDRFGEAIAQAARGRPARFNVEIHGPNGQFRATGLAERLCVRGEVGVYVVHGWVEPKSLDLLTDRERSVAQLLPHLAPKQIAARLGVSVSTIHTHIRKTRVKLRKRTTAELIAWLSRYIPPPPQ